MTTSSSQSHHFDQIVGFIGTGIMGEPIAQHLLNAGYTLLVHNRSAAKAQHLVEAGATYVDSPAEIARRAHVVFTMVGYPEDVEEVYLAEDGLLAAAKPSTWLVDLTTSSAQLAREIHESAELLGVHAIDCPVTGGQIGAQAGNLTLIVGAREQDCAEIMPLLECFSSKRFFFDGAGMGQFAKLCNQISLAGSMLGMAEALAFAQQVGLNQERMLEMVSGGMGSSRALTDLAPKALAGDWAPGFLSEHFLKDLGLALQVAQEQEIALPATETAFTLYDMLCETGGAKLGTQALSLCYQDEATGSAAGLDWSQLDHGGDDECGCHHNGEHHGEHHHDGHCEHHHHDHNGHCEHHGEHHHDGHCEHHHHDHNGHCEHHDGHHHGGHCEHHGRHHGGHCEHHDKHHQHDYEHDIARNKKD